MINWSISRAPWQWPGSMEEISFVSSMKYQACPIDPFLLHRVHVVAELCRALRSFSTSHHCITFSPRAGLHRRKAPILHRSKTPQRDEGQKYTRRDQNISERVCHDDGLFDERDCGSTEWIDVFAVCWRGHERCVCRSSVKGKGSWLILFVWGSGGGVTSLYIC